ncbi:MAG TPA: acyl-CoA dehydrogenase family protein [Alphaproteobacteria bacterium]|nr:acyl-CoA dehydrogenase family protein [Alphaproteobacteria bacterium]
MDFAYSPKTEALRAKLQSFMDDHVIPENVAWERAVHEGRFPIEIMQRLKPKAKAEGLWNMFLPHLPEGVPGTGLSNIEYAPLAEIMGRLFWASEVFNCSPPDTGNMELLTIAATPEQRERWLMPLFRGEIRSCFAMTEPDVASSDANNIATRIERRGDEYVINGRKWFITGAEHPHCKVAIVMGITNPDGDKHARHSMILVPMDAPGVTVVRNIAVMNHIDPEGHSEIVFKDVRVPVSNLLGEEGKGFALAQARLGPGRIHHCMRSLGQCELALELMGDRAMSRVTFGKPLAERDTVRDWIALSRMEIDQARLLVLRAAWAIDQHGSKAAMNDISMIKYVVPRVHVNVFNRAIQTFGSAGLSPDTPLATLWTWGRVMQLGDGPDEVHIRGIGRAEIARIKSLGGKASRYLTPYHAVHGDPTR